MEAPGAPPPPPLRAAASCTAAIMSGVLGVRGVRPWKCGDGADGAATTGPPAPNASTAWRLRRPDGELPGDDRPSDARGGITPMPSTLSPGSGRRGLERRCALAMPPYLRSCAGSWREWSKPPYLPAEPPPPLGSPVPTTNRSSSRWPRLWPYCGFNPASWGSLGPVPPYAAVAAGAVAAVAAVAAAGGGGGDAAAPSAGVAYALGPASAPPPAARECVMRPPWRRPQLPPPRAVPPPPRCVTCVGCLNPTTAKARPHLRPLTRRHRRPTQSQSSAGGCRHRARRTPCRVPSPSLGPSRPPRRPHVRSPLRLAAS
eukprot:326675-Chlamydomonas_euryale.AAC.2